MNGTSANMTADIYTVDFNLASLICATQIQGELDAVGQINLTPNMFVTGDICTVNSMTILPVVLGCSSIDQTTMVTIILMDADNLLYECSSTIFISDNLPPSIICPDNIELSICEEEAYISIPMPLVDDNCEVDYFVNDYNQGVDASDIYQPGTTTVTWIVYDVNGNQNQCVQTITVNQYPQPTIVLPFNEISTMYPDTLEIDIGTYSSYLWDNGSSTNPFEVPWFGTYSVTVSNSFGCTDNASIQIKERQDIFIPDNWSMFSTYINTTDNIAIIFAGLESQFKIIKDDFGHVYWPQKGVNTIGAMTLGYAYDIKAYNDFWLTVDGSAVSPQLVPISLDKNFNLVGYLHRNPASVSDMINSIANDVKAIFDDDGKIYWPTWNTNQIGTMYPGKGYKFKMKKARTFTYPAATGSTKGESDYIQPEYFNVNINTGNYMAVAFPQSAWNTVPEKSSEIGAFDNNGNLIGGGVFNGEVAILSVWGKDELESESNKGLLENGPISFKLWLRESNKEYELEIISWSEGDGMYHKNNTATASAIRYDNDDKICRLTSFPNPFISSINLDIVLTRDANFSIHILNTLGEVIQVSSLNNQQKGTHKLQFDLSSHAPGIYYVKLECGDEQIIHKITKL